MYLSLSLFAFGCNNKVEGKRRKKCFVFFCVALIGTTSVSCLQLIRSVRIKPSLQTMCDFSAFQAGEVVARWAEAAGPGGSVADQSLLEVLPNPHAGGRLLPPPHDGGRIRWTSKCRPSPPLSSLSLPRPSPCWLMSFCLGCSLRNPNFACCFIPFHAGLWNWKPPPCWEIMKVLIVRTILM